MAFSVIRSSQGLVKPYFQTPWCTLDLSVIDRLPVLKWKTKTLHVFGNGTAETASVIREALSKVLVPYYPLAGRLKISSQGQLQIECGGQGVWFVEASANCTLDSVNSFDDFTSIPYDDLLPDYVSESEGTEPRVQMQVTQFKCGGFVIGLIFCHRICDGAGAARFLNALGEIARGFENPKITPVWCREFIPPPPQAANITTLEQVPPPLPTYKLEYTDIEITMDKIDRIKREFHQSTGRRCSTFEVVAAAFWKYRTLAINLKQNTEVKLVFFANCRQLFYPPLPTGFYGNCFFPATITSPSESLAKASHIHVINLIQEAKARLPIEIAKFVNGNYMKKGEDPFAPPLLYTTMFISEWGRLGFDHVDYGWGSPVHIVPIIVPRIRPVGIVGSLPSPKKGIRLMTWCVEEAHRQQFIDQMMKVA